MKKNIKNLIKMSKINSLTKINEKDIPAWIEESDYFIAMKESELIEKDANGKRVYILPAESVFEFPTKLNSENIESVLESIRYFGVSKRSRLYSVFEFLFEHPKDVDLVELQQKFPEFKRMWKNINYDIDTYGNKCKTPLVKGVKPMCIELKRIGKKTKLDSGLITIACLNDDEYLLMYLYNHGCKIEPSAFKHAIYGRNSSCLEFIYDKFRTETKKYLHRYKFTAHDIEMSCKLNFLSGFKFIGSVTHNLDILLCQENAAYYGALSVLMFLVNGSENVSTELEKCLISGKRGAAMGVQKNKFSNFDGCFKYLNSYKKYKAQENK